MQRHTCLSDYPSPAHECRDKPRCDRCKRRVPPAIVPTEWGWESRQGLRQCGD
jgi:hypothetical protein